MDRTNLEPELNLKIVPAYSQSKVSIVCEYSEKISMFYALQIA